MRWLAVARLALVLGFLALPSTAKPQTAAKVFRIGILAQFPPNTPESARLWEALLQGLWDLGYVEGRNLVVEGRYSQGSYEHLPALAAELVRLKVDVIVAAGPPSPETAKRVTSTIPIVMTSHPDPVGSGLVTSLARPGGNVTGLSTLAPELLGKQLQLLKQAVPGLSRVAVLSNPTNPFHARPLNEAEAAARSLGVRLQSFGTRAPSEFAGTLSAMTREGTGALISLADPLFFGHRARLAELATRHRLPMMAPYREYAEAGSLMVYGVSLTHSFRRAATYVDRIFRGAKPGDLPVEEPTKLELIVNLKTAKALGLTIPESVLQRADEVIQ